jgi:heme oxygenase
VKEESGLVPSVEKFVTREEFERVLEQLKLFQKPTEQAVSSPAKEKVELLSF